MDFPNVLQTRHGIKKLCGIPSDSCYQNLTFKLTDDAASFVYNISYIVDANLKATSYHVWYKSKEDECYSLTTD